MKPLNAITTLNAFLTTLVVMGAGLCLVFAATLVWWAADRDAPFVMLEYRVAPAKAGTNTTVYAEVRRDLARNCSVNFSRAFYDSKGVRFDLTEGPQLMNRAALEAFDQRSPNILAFNVNIPLGARPGMGAIVTALDYQCNPVHQKWPISMVLNMDVEVLP